MSDPKTFWLVVTNIALGLALLVLILGIACGALCDFLAKLKQRRVMMAELDRDLHHLFGESRSRK